MAECQCTMSDTKSFRLKIPTPTCFKLLDRRSKFYVSIILVQREGKIRLENAVMDNLWTGTLGQEFPPKETASSLGKDGSIRYFYVCPLACTSCRRQVE